MTKLAREIPASPSKEHVKGNDRMPSKQNTPSISREDIATNDPKIDWDVITKYNKLADSSKGIINLNSGADYHLSHPLGSSDVPSASRRIANCLAHLKNAT